MDKEKTLLNKNDMTKKCDIHFILYRNECNTKWFYWTVTTKHWKLSLESALKFISWVIYIHFPPDVGSDMAS